MSPSILSNISCNIYLILKVKKGMKLHQICNQMRPTPFFYLKPFRNGMQLKLTTLIHKWQKNQNLFLWFFFHILFAALLLYFLKLRARILTKSLPNTYILYSVSHCVKKSINIKFFRITMHKQCRETNHDFATICGLE